MMSKLLGFYVNMKNKIARGDVDKSKEITEDIVKRRDINTLKDVSTFIRETMTWKADPLFGIIDIQRDVDRIKDRDWKDDCDGFSILAKRLTDVLGYKSYMLTYLPLKIWKAHVICVVETDKSHDLLLTSNNHERKQVAKELIKNNKPGYIAICNGIIRGPFKDVDRLIEHYEGLISSKILTYDIRDGL